LQDARQVLISRNPQAGARDNQPVVAELIGALQRKGLEATEFTSLDELRQSVERCQRESTLRCVVAAGGDGTVALLANLLTPETPLAILPLGTENLLAKFLEIKQPASPRQVADWIVQGTMIRLDAGQANQRLFLIMVGCGFDAEVVRRLHSQRTGHIHHASYARPIWEAIRSYRYPKLRIVPIPSSDVSDSGSSNDSSVPKDSRASNDPSVSSDSMGSSDSVDLGDSSASSAVRTSSDPAVSGLSEMPAARWVFVVNLPRYAGGLQFAPQAVGTDGLLDVCTFRRGSLWHGLRYLLGVATGRHRHWPDYQHVQVPALRIECDEPIPYQCDGDPGGLLPVTIRVLPRRLRMIANPAWGTSAEWAPEFLPPPRNQTSTTISERDDS
jgi:diacylglycerol kinase (ATP)